VKHPSHYAEGRKYEPKDVIRDWKLNFNLGSAVKYISRAGRKDDIVQDLKKAQQFIQFEIDAIEEESLIDSIERGRFAEANWKGEKQVTERNEIAKILAGNIIPEKRVKTKKPTGCGEPEKRYVVMSTEKGEKK
jgi:hypothetical protein